ncbi:IS4 family transposase, partial [Fischerella thermalis CCMEE 5273]
GNPPRFTHKRGALMSQINTLLHSLQCLLPPNQIQEIVKKYNVCDTARKLTVYEFLKFSVVSAVGQWKSYRESEDQLAAHSELVAVDHSTLSKKARDLPFSILKDSFHYLTQRCNRHTRRQLSLPKASFATDSTTLTVAQAKLPWATFRGGKSGIKLHVRFHLQTLAPSQVEESIAQKHDSPWAETLLPLTGITVYDRGYLDLKRMDHWQKEGHGFVIRLKANTILSRSKGLKRLSVDDSNVLSDQSAILGSGKPTTHRFRVVTFTDPQGKIIRVATNVWQTSAETIAALYKERWQVELFFRWIKQHLQVKRLYGTSPNAVYNQLFGALIAFVLLHWLYQQTQLPWRIASLSFTYFVRKLLLGQLPTEVYLLLDKLFHSNQFG